MTSFGYTGPATLIIGGTELHITARLAVESEAVNGFITRRWTADLIFHPFKPPNEDTPCTLRLPDGREGSGHLPTGETRMVGAGFPPTALPPSGRADAVDERGYVGPATLISDDGEHPVNVRLTDTLDWSAELDGRPPTPLLGAATIRLPDGREAKGRVVLVRASSGQPTHWTGEFAGQGSLPEVEPADDIEVHAVDERGRHITRIIPGAPPATDHTLIPTAELAELRQRAERAEAAIVRALAAIHTTGPDSTDWQRGWRACADHATRALNGKTKDCR